MPKRDWKVEPPTETEPLLPVILTVTTRPPQLPEPSRLVTCTFFTVPTEGQAVPMLLAVSVRVQAWDMTTPSYGSRLATR